MNDCNRLRVMAKYPPARDPAGASSVSDDPPATEAAVVVLYAGDAPKATSREEDSRCIWF